MIPEALQPDQELYVLRQRLNSVYSEIEAKARQTIQQGEAVDNPLLTGETKEARYALATCLLINGDADAFLEDAAMSLQTINLDARYNQSGFRHIALREVMFGEQGRRAAGIDAASAKRYYEALRKGFSNLGKPVQLELVRVMPTIDREQNSISLVGAFLPKDDTTIVTVRQKINESIEEDELPLHGRLGDIRVLFSTIGRLVHAPKGDKERARLLETLDMINAKLPIDCSTTIENIDIASTTPEPYGSYLWPDKNIFMVPPISLVKPTPDTGPHFVIPMHRKILGEVDK